LDYKERIELTSKTNLASFAKDVIGMANSNGGTIIIGVKEESPGKFEPIGIDENSLEQYEVTKLNKALFQYLDPSFFIESKFIKYASKWFCLLNIPAAKEFPILAKKQNDDAKLYLGRFYIRSNAAETCEIQTSNELRQLLVNFQEKA
jgi:predicted HTH transcriptional regulator